MPGIEPLRDFFDDACLVLEAVDGEVAMKRRSFLQALGLVAVAPALPALSKPAPEKKPEWPRVFHVARQPQFVSWDYGSAFPPSDRQLYVSCNSLQEALQLCETYPGLLDTLKLEGLVL